MKKVLTALVAGGLLLTTVGATTAPAVAEAPATLDTAIVAPTESVAYDTVQVTTTAAPATIEPVGATTDGTAVYNLVGVAQLEATPVAPTETVAPVAPVATATAAPATETVAPVATAPATEAPAKGSTADTVPQGPITSPLEGGQGAWAGAGTYNNVTSTPAPTVAAQTADTYPAPLPVTPTCYEDGTTSVPGVTCVWDCATMGNKICGNPDCIAKNQFTVTPEGDCSATPSGYGSFDLQAEGMAMGFKLGQLYINSGSNKDMKIDTHCSYDIIPSVEVPTAVHVFVKKPGTLPADCPK